MKPTGQRFSAGPLAFHLDDDSGFVRGIRFHGHEVLRGIYPDVRDADWETLRPHMRPLEARTTGESVLLRLRGRVVGRDIDLTWTADIEALAAGRLTYRWRGKAGKASVTNRAGLCVLHPAELAGAPCVVEHTDGNREAGWFPRDISPHQPFRDIRALTHVLDGGAEIMVRMEGDVFEMEDQRNWTDASFKTYCRPLDWPRPYRLALGEEVEHRVTLEVRGVLPPAVRSEPPATPASFHELMQRPEVGFTLPGPVPDTFRERLRALRPAHVRVETHATALEAALEWAGAEAVFLECTLVVAVRGATTSVPGRDRFPKRSVVHLFDEAGMAVSRETMAAWSHAGYTSLGTGTLGHFAELNRNPPPGDGAHTLTAFGICAQVHAWDDTSIWETLSQHAAVVRAAHRIGAARPVVVAPLSLGRTAHTGDARLHEAFAADWLLASLTQLASTRCVQSVSCFQTHGQAGFLREDVETPLERMLRDLAEGMKPLSPPRRPDPNLA